MKGIANAWKVAAIVCLWLGAGGAVAYGQQDEESGSTAARAFGRELHYLDANADGAIDAREFAVGQQMAQLILALNLSECDQNGDAVVSAEEWSAAAAEVIPSLLEEPTAGSDEAEEALVEAVPLSLVLERLAGDERYAAEIAALREAVGDLEDEEAVVTQVISNPTRYVHLRPALRVWSRHYPAKHVLRHRVWGQRPGAGAKPGAAAKPSRRGGAAGPQKPGRPGRKPGGPRGRRGGGRR